MNDRALIHELNVIEECLINWPAGWQEKALASLRAAREHLARENQPAAVSAQCGQWSKDAAVSIAHRAGFAGTCWTMGPYELVHLLNMASAAAQPAPKAPSDDFPDDYEV